MSVLINLLPWREQERELMKKEFFLFLGFFCSLMVFVVMGIFLVYSQMISNQEKINRRLTKEITALDQEIKTIESYEAEKERLVARMMVIQELQARRPQTVKVLDAVARVIPEGIYLQGMVRVNDEVNLLGVSESNTDVSNLMRALEVTGWLKNANLSEIKTVLAPNKKDSMLEFKMGFEIYTELSTTSSKYLEKIRKDKEAKNPKNNAKNKTPPKKN